MTTAEPSSTIGQEIRPSDVDLPPTVLIDITSWLRN